MLFECTWNGYPFECCEHFLPLQTEFGLCFAINSVQTQPKLKYPLIANRENGPGQLNFSSYEDITIHIHSIQDVPYVIDNDMKETILYGSVKNIIISVTEIINDPAAIDVPVNFRQCRFEWELENGPEKSLYKYYSHSACTVECASDAQMKYCNCTHHLMPVNKYGNTFFN